GVGVVESAPGTPAALPPSRPAGDQTTSVLATARTARVTPRRAEVVVATIMAAAGDRRPGYSSSLPRPAIDLARSASDGDLSDLLPPRPDRPPATPEADAPSPVRPVF